MAGVVLSFLALVAEIAVIVRIGTWFVDNSDAVARLSRCMNSSAAGPEMRDCFRRFADETGDDI